MQRYKYPIPICAPGRNTATVTSPKVQEGVFVWPDIVPESPTNDHTLKLSWYRRSFKNKKFSSSPKTQFSFFDDTEDFEIATTPKASDNYFPFRFINGDESFAKDLIGQCQTESYDSKLKWFNRFSKLKAHDTIPSLRKNGFRRSRRGSRSTDNLPSDLQRLEDIANKKKLTVSHTPLTFRRSRRGSRSIENLPSDLQRYEEMVNKRKWFNRFPSLSSRSSSKTSLKHSHSSDNIDEILEVKNYVDNDAAKQTSNWLMKLSSKFRSRLKKSFRLNVITKF